MNLNEMLQDAKGSPSISRAIPALVVVWILTMATFVTIKTGVLADIPPGWREIFLIAIGPYLASKAGEAVGTLTDKKETPDA